ncbi:helix-turn-helix domain-containing protein [Kitasatospora sp. NPDC001159]
MASAWKELPEELPQTARQLAEELRAIKDAAGLSLAELATRTHYSRASWERWLNGKRVVTEQALEALVGAVECDAAKLRRLWRLTVEPAAEPTAEMLAADAPSAAAHPVDEPPVDGPAAADPAGEPTADELMSDGPAAEPADGPAVPWWRRPAALISGASVLALLLVLVGLRVARHDGQASAAGDPPPPAVPTAQPVPSEAACQAVGCAHKDPQKTGCGKDARTLQTQVIGKVVVYLRYSQKCQAAWSAITEGEPKDYAVITDSNGDSETALIHWGYDNHSAMLNAADPGVGFQVCGYQPAGHDCTATVVNLAAAVASTPIPIGPLSPPPGTVAPATPGDSASPVQPSAAGPAQASPSPSASASAN